MSRLLFYFRKDRNMPALLDAPNSRSRLTTKEQPYEYIKAKAALATMKTNRNVRTYSVIQYAEDMVSDKWFSNGETIKFDSDGCLIDGQHRLLAIVYAFEKMGKRVLINFIEVYGVTERAKPTIDTSSRRTTADTLTMDGKKNSTLLAGAYNWLYKYRHNAIRNTSNNISNDEVRELSREHSNLESSIPKVRGYGTVKTRKSYFVALHYLFSMISPEKADAFFDDLCTGANLEPDDGVYKLRDRLIKEIDSKAKLSSIDVMAITIKAWNARMQNQSVGTLRWRTTGDSPESFPEIHNLSPSDVS